MYRQPTLSSVFFVNTASVAAANLNVQKQQLMAIMAEYLAKQTDKGATLVSLTSLEGNITNMVANGTIAP